MLSYQIMSCYPLRVYPLVLLLLADNLGVIKGHNMKSVSQFTSLIQEQVLLFIRDASLLLKNSWAIMLRFSTPRLETGFSIISDQTDSPPICSIYVIPKKTPSVRFFLFGELQLCHADSLKSDTLLQQRFVSTPPSPQDRPPCRRVEGTPHRPTWPCRYSPLWRRSWLPCPAHKLHLQ